MNEKENKEVQKDEAMNIKFFTDRLKKYVFTESIISNRVYGQGTKMSNKFHVKERIFLNLDLDMPAYAIAIVEDTSEHQGETSEDFYYGDISLSLSDCYRRVTYDFNLSDKESRKAALYKARRIAKVVNAFRDALEKEVKLIESLQKPKSKKAKSAKA